MPKLELLSEMERKMLLDFPCLQYDTAPFKTLRKKVSQSKISLITSAGLHLRTDKPFQRGDQTYRVLPSSTSKNEIIQSHISIGFDHTPFYRDINVVYPVDRIRELLHRGVVGSISENYYSFMGATADPREMIEKTGPEVAQRLLNESVDVVLLTPIWPLCTHTVSVLARVLEEAGIATITIVLVREHAEKVKPPRALFVPFPFGSTVGKPNDIDLQHRVLAAALGLLEYETGPVLAAFPEELDGQVRLIQASSLSGEQLNAETDPADEIAGLGPFYESWLLDNKGRTVVGLCGIPHRRFRDVVRFLQAYANGEDAEFEERSPEVARPQFIRHCVDDLKAFYYEGRMAQHPGVNEEELHRWFWSKTATGRLVKGVAKRMNATDDPDLQRLSFGIAR